MLEDLAKGKRDESDEETDSSADEDEAVEEVKKDEESWFHTYAYIFIIEVLSFYDFPSIVLSLSVL